MVSSLANDHMALKVGTVVAGWSAEVEGEGWSGHSEMSGATRAIADGD